MINKNLNMLDIITILSFIIGIYALEVALENLKENEEQNNDLKDILHYLDTHLQDQDNHLKEQDKILINLTK